jgi:hypothetical protein
MGFRITQYSGVNKVEGHERYAVEYGPVLLAVVGDEKTPAHIKLDPSKPQDYLKQASSGRLKFDIAGSSFSLIPYCQVTEEQNFTIFPVLDK